MCVSCVKTILMLPLAAFLHDSSWREGFWVGVGAVFGFYPHSVGLNPSLRLAYTLHITRFGLSSLFSGAAVGLAMATATSGIRHFIRPPLSAAN